MPCFTNRTNRAIFTRFHEIDSAPIRWRVTGFHGRIIKFPAGLDRFSFISMGQDTEIPDTHKTIRNYMEHEPAHERKSIHPHDFFLVSVFVIFVYENDHAVISGYDPMVADRNFVCVSREIFNNAVAVLKRFFQVNHPRDFKERIYKSLKQYRIFVICALQIK